MSDSVSVEIVRPEDEQVILTIARLLKENSEISRSIRDFSETMKDDQRVEGLKFQPRPGQVLACHFGLGFRQPEMVKTRPVLVVSPKVRVWSGTCLVVPISSTPPAPVLRWHLRLPDTLLPGSNYKEAWLKGDCAMSVGKHRLDRWKAGPRNYVVPEVSPEILAAARMCVRHAIGAAD